MHQLEDKKCVFPGVNPSWTTATTSDYANRFVELFTLNICMMQGFKSYSPAIFERDVLLYIIAAL